jgi:DNA-binding NtrC family response regulator
MTPLHPSTADRADSPIVPLRESIASILIVDDDPIVLALLQAFLTREGFTVWSAVGGSAAQSLFVRHHAAIDLVLIDVRMPDMDGPETLRALHRLDSEVTYCFMSGYTGQYSEDNLLKMGAAHLFAKPFDLDELARSLRHLVGNSRLRRTA